MDTLHYFQQVYGQVPDWVQKMHDYQPKALEYYTKLRNEIMVDGAVSKKTKELVLVGINAARRYERSMIYHTKGALDSGATIEELVEILTPCILSRGIPAWLEGIKAIQYAHDYTAKQNGKPTAVEGHRAFQCVGEAIVYFKRESGGQTPEWVQLMEKEAAHVLQHYGSLRASILKDGIVPRKVKEFVLIGINVSERYKEGVQIHITSAKNLGATDQEIAEITLTALLTAGIPAWFEGSDFLHFKNV